MPTGIKINVVDMSTRARGRHSHQARKQGAMEAYATPRISKMLVFNEWSGQHQWREVCAESDKQGRPVPGLYVGERSYYPEGSHMCHVERI